MCIHTTNIIHKLRKQQQQQQNKKRIAKRKRAHIQNKRQAATH